MMPSEMMDDLVTWLRARLDEDAADINESRALSPGDLHWSMPDWLDRPRLLAEVDAKRRILDEVVGGLAKEERWARRFAVHLARLLALPYADQPGYREEWRP